MKKKIIWIIIISIFLIIFYLYKEINENKKKQSKNKNLSISEDILFNSNTFSDVNYSTKDANGNEYIIEAKKGEVDYSDPNTIFLTDVYALIKLSNSNNIEITSNYGKYNTLNFDTIFSKNVIVNYLENKINGEYLDFSIGRNSMIISKNVIYTNLDNILKADVVEIEVDTKNTKIFMHNMEKKVNIQSREYGNN
tara:strand:+ start:456 stop:1040 length:585 start_codon:yes stop_codon:yes gene_type:complete